MTYFPSRIERLRGIQESSFCTDMSGSMGSFFEVPFHEGTLAMELLRPTETPMHAQQRLGGYPTRVLMPKAATLSFDCNLETFTTKATSTVAATSHWLAEMLECALGGSHLMTGTTAAGTPTTTVMSAAVVTTIRPGAAVGLTTPGGLFEFREVKSKSGNAITLKLATTSAVATSSTINGSTTNYYHTRMTGADALFMQFAVEGFNTEDRWLLRGGALDSLAFTFGPGAIPKVNFKWKFARWDQSDGSNTSATLRAAEISAATYTNTVTLVQADSEHRCQTVGTSTLSGTLLESSTIEITPNVSWVPVKTSSGTNTVKQWVKVHTAPTISGSFTVPYEADQSWFTAHTSKTLKAHWLQIGSSTTDGGVLISIPSTQIIGTPTRVDVNGVQGLKIDFVSKLDSDTTAESSYEALAESPFRVHFI